MSKRTIVLKRMKISMTIKKGAYDVRRLIVFSITLAMATGLVLADAQQFWPQWRGPQATGVAPHANPPIEWSEDKNIRWKVEIPGKGLATPIVWGNMVFLPSAIGTETEAPSQATSPPPRRGNIQPTRVVRFEILALDRKTGETLWQKTAREEVPHEGTHPDGSWASNSPITDGEHLYAYFGSRGLYCYDLQGNLKWEKDLGDMRTKNGFGEGSSPALHGDLLILNWDHEGPSFIVAFDKNTGEERWRMERDEGTAWATPIVVEHMGSPQVITTATNRTRSYDLKSGALLWECSGMTANTIPSPVASNGMIYVMSGFRGNALQAIDLASAKGDITNSKAIAWQFDRDTPYVPSPLLYGEKLYFIKSNQGILSCFNVSTGEPHYGPQRLDDIEGVYASPVGAADRVYIVGRNGVALVIKHGSSFEILAMNSLDDGFDASPAVVDNEIYLRGRNALYCIAEN